MRTAISAGQWQPWTAKAETKQLSMATTARVIWLCECVKYWPDRGLVLTVSLAFMLFLFSTSFPCWQFSGHAQYSALIANFGVRDGSNLANFHSFIIKVNNSA